MTDFGLLSAVTASPQVEALTGDHAVLTALLDVESTWSAVLEDAGLVPAGAADAVAEAADPDLYDPASLARQAQGGGNPVIPLVSALKARVREIDPAAVKAVHASLTSQDVQDTALMLLAARVRAELLRELSRTTTALARLSEEHADTLCVGRSLGQHALPYTFGLKAAQWLQGLNSAGRRLGEVALPAQFGGAVGTLASATLLTAGSSVSPFVLTQDHASRLGLAAPHVPWHGDRQPVTVLGDALAGVLDAAGKIAGDVLFLTRPEVAELGEPTVAGRGVSSAMPQKQNPVLSVLLRSAALQGPTFASQLHLAAGLFNDERADGAWHSEWPALRALLSLSLGAVLTLREMIEGLRVFPDAMRRNLDLTGPLLLSERVKAAVAPLLGDAGQEALQAAVDAALRVSPEERPDAYARGLRAAVPAEALSDDALAELLDPAGYLGEAEEIRRRILDSLPDTPDSQDALDTQDEGATRD
ncbi:3-carboxy-cis,cis-muconate cycloisomerase [Arthrobacter woluwensis]|uniref:lyase family protein n=1 Tax=Arthrobacter woluwensis TaxID=156980 RepID=UPI000D13604B|nr:lyase family protein [Arthrobacter woluwensis]PSS43061.1 3-carboxy-cis,cis-muconate cycloisomerase [Arthrobacter woluwensis]